MSWKEWALALLDEQEEPTPLVEFPAGGSVTVLMKDESVHPTGTMRHRHARALFRQAIAEGLVTEGTTVVEATGGNAAVAQAWFARRLGLPYVVVMPGQRSEERARRVEELGGECRFVTPPLAIYEAAREIEGIGRPRVEPGFRGDLVDRVIPVPDEESRAAARRIAEVTGHPVGDASGTALVAGLRLAERVKGGLIVTVIGGIPASR
ncbi:pyridoxal-phosphate dependent enzyme [Nonomuraea dietziae]|uniref:pyridoxal-phosphate dependent enzyme n=1 Tax=Nonomuraea dietziae TaxID=65515 RepID=UPI0033CA8C9F